MTTVRLKTPVHPVNGNVSFFDKECFGYANQLCSVPLVELQPDPMQPHKPMDPETLVNPLDLIRSRIGDLGFLPSFQSRGRWSPKP